MSRRLLTTITIALVALVSQALPRVFIVNIYPGNKIYELEGHSALVVEDSGYATAYNYGVFDFNSPNFVYRFIKGETDYMLAAYPYAYFQAQYEKDGRRIVAHELNLDSLETVRLQQYLNRNLLPENRVYRYNYVKDNCATRPLKVVEAAVGDSIILGAAPFEAVDSEPTFRKVMRHYHRNYPWYQFGIDLSLGSGIDYPISRREMAFAPTELDGMLADATIAGRKLVKNVTVVNDTAPDAAIEGPTPGYLSPLFIGFLLLFALILIGRKDTRLSRIIDSIFFGIIGIEGCILTFLIFVSVHEATSPNYLYLWLNPLSLLVPVLIWFPKTSKVLGIFMWLYILAILAMLVTRVFSLQVMNPAILPLIFTTLIRCGYRASSIRNNNKHNQQ